MILQEQIGSPEPSQEMRKQRLHDYCLTHRFNKKPTEEELQFIAVDDENKIIYCALQKVGSKTLIRLLGKARGINGRVRRWDAFQRLGNYTEEEKLFRLQTYFKFVIVREPLQRLLSTFKERYRDGAPLRHVDRHNRERIVSRLRPNDANPEGKNGDYDVSFSEFIQYFAGNVSRYPPCRQFEKICHPCVINYDFIGRLETLNEDGPRILKLTGIDDRVTFPRIHKSTDSDDVLEYYSQLPPHYIRQLGEHYRNDFEMFSYEYLGSVKKLLDQPFSKGP